MRCSQCPTVVDADSPDADGWLRVTLDRRELSPVVSARGSQLRTVQLQQLWCCSLECWIGWAARLADAARLEELARDLDNPGRPADDVDDAIGSGLGGSVILLDVEGQAAPSADG